MCSPQSFPPLKFQKHSRQFITPKHCQGTRYMPPPWGHYFQLVMLTYVLMIQRLSDVNSISPRGDYTLFSQLCFFVGSSSLSRIHLFGITQFMFQIVSYYFLVHHYVLFRGCFLHTPIPPIQGPPFTWLTWPYMFLVFSIPLTYYNDHKIYK